MKMMKELNLKQIVIKSSLCDYSDAYILVTGDITVAVGDENTNAAFKNCAPFTECVTHINDEHIGTADDFDITMPMHNLIEYIDNFSDTSGSLWQCKRDESPINDNGNSVNVAANNSSSFKYKSSILGKPAAVGNNGVLKNVKIAVPLKYLSNFWRSIEMPLINCESHLELSWTKNFVMSDNDNDNNNATLKITNTKLYIPIVTLSTKDNVKLTKQLNEGFKRPVYWNECKIKIEPKYLDNNNPILMLLFKELKDCSCF